MPRHIVLLGDSILDNESYCEGGPAVVEHLQGMLAGGDRATLCAVDGAVTIADRSMLIPQVADQLGCVPADATHLILSIGGNDALHRINVLSQKAGNVLNAFAVFHDVIEEFRPKYASCVAGVLRLGRPLTLCTIYNGNFDAAETRGIQTAVALFNDVIQRTANRLGLAVLELRDVCTKPEDYYNPIEPSSAGGRKIAKAIRDHVNTAA
jgi:hypothetical protein